MGTRSGLGVQTLTISRHTLPCKALQMLVPHNRDRAILSRDLADAPSPVCAFAPLDQASRVRLQPGRPVAPLPIAAPDDPVAAHRPRPSTSGFSSLVKPPFGLSYPYSPGRAHNAAAYILKTFTVT